MRSDLNLTLGLAVVSLLLPVAVAVMRRRVANPGDLTPDWAGQLARFFYFAGLPYLAVIGGLITPRLLGLRGAEHFALITWSGDTALRQLQQALTLMWLEWLLDSPATIIVGGTALLIAGGVGWALRRGRVFVVGLQQTTLEIAYFALHWAFYRALFWSLTEDFYLGVVAGLGWVLLEWALIQWVDRQPEQAQFLLVQSMLLLLTAVVFFYSPNLWLLFPVHWLLAALMWRAVQQPSGPDLAPSSGFR